MFVCGRDPCDPTKFELRKKELFDVLEAKAKELQKDSFPTPAYNSSASPMSRSLKTYRGKESIFKTPDIPPTRIKVKQKAPDYKLHPHRWTKYTLDVADMTDGSNTSAATSFLREIQQRKRVKEDTKDEKVVFRKRNVDVSINEDKKSFKGSTLVMPEYVVGTAKCVKKSKKIIEQMPTSSVKLNHLYEEDE